MKKVMLHMIKPERLNGPNSVIRLIEESRISQQYELSRLIQSTLPGKNPFKFYIAIREMIKQIKQIRPDIVQITGLQFAGFCAALAAKISGVKCIVVGILGFAGDDLSVNPFERFIYSYLIEPLTIIMSRYCFTVCKYSENKPMIKYIARKKHFGTIYNAVPVQIISYVKKTTFRKEFKIGKEEIIVAVVGRLVHDKGHDYIIDAWKKQTFINTRLVIIGEGPYDQKYREKLHPLIAAGIVILTGQRQDVKAILSEVDIFLFATLHENLSMALLEALSAGCAVIATNVGGNPEVIKNGVNGILIPERSSESIIHAVNLLITNSTLRSEISKRAQNIDEKFSIITYEKNIEALYGKCLSERPI